MGIGGGGERGDEWRLRVTIRSKENREVKRKEQGVKEKGRAKM